MQQDRKGVHKNKKKRSTKDRFVDYQSLNVLRYQSFQTLKICSQDRNYYIQTDKKFLKDVENIAKIRKNALFEFLQKQGKNLLTDQQCDEIDHKARLHYKANVINSNSNLDFKDVQEKKRCNCGCRRVAGDQLQLCTDQQKLNILGPGILLMFLYKRSIIAVLGMILIIYGIYALTTNLIGDSAYIQGCQGDPYCEYKHNSSIENKSYENTSLLFAQLWLGLVFSFVWVVTLRFIKFIGREKNKMVDLYLRSASDYTIKIENLPYGGYSQVELIQYFDGLYDKIDQKYKKNDESQGNPFKMKSIQVIYNMQFSRQMVQQIFYLCYVVDSFLIKPQGQTHRNYVKDVKSYQQNKNKLKQTYQLLIDLRKKFLNDPTFRQSISTTCCLIEFKSQYMRQTLLQNFGIQKVSILKQIQSKIRDFFFGGAKDIIFKGNIIQIQRAPEPSDLLWTNCEKLYSLKRKLIIYLVTFIIVFGSFGIQMGLQYLQNDIKSSPNKYFLETQDQTQTLTILNIVMSISILLVNRFLWFSLYYILELQYNHTLTQKIVSQMNKVLLAASINTIIVPLITRQISIIIDPSTQYSTLYATDGLSGMVFDYQISVLAGLVIKLFDPLFFLKKIVIQIKCLRNLFIRFICGKIPQVIPEKGVSQINKFYEGSYMDVAQTYMYIIGAVLHAAFFCHLQPFTIVLVFCMIVVFYLINRFKLLRFCLIPEMTELLVFETALTHAGLVPIVYGVGCLVISYFQQQVNPERLLQWSFAPSFTSIGIGILAFFNPGNFLNKIVEKIMEKCKCISIQKLIGDEDQSNEAEIDDQLGEQNKNKTNRVEVYYENSNSLKLLGFEKVLKGEQQRQIMNQLQNFCESFFPKKNKQDKTSALKLVGQQINQNQKGNILNFLKIPPHLKNIEQRYEQEQQKHEQNSAHKLMIKEQNQKISENNQKNENTSNFDFILPKK